MNTNSFFKRFSIGCLFIILLTGFTQAISETSIPEPTATVNATLTPLSFIDSTEFPTGIFKQVGGHLMVDFRDDGSAFWHSERQGFPELHTKYGVNGNLYSEMQFSYPFGRILPATYYWTYDGQLLAFQVWGKDLEPSRRASYHGQTYRFMQDVETVPTSDSVDFPTGMFINEGGLLAFNFDEDGTWFFFEENLEQPVRSGKYVTNGNYFTEMTHNDPDFSQVPVTYIWTYDGQTLRFELWGEDVNEHRKSIYDGQTYTWVDG